MLNQMRPSRRVIEVTGLAIDKTGSMTEKDYLPSRMAAAQEAALEFIKRKPVIDGRDRTAAIAFDERAFLVSPFGRHPALAGEDLNQLTAAGDTCITAGLRLAFDLVRDEAKRFPGATLRCVLLSDGEHNSGAHPIAAGVVKEMEHAGVIIDCVGIGGAGENLLREIAKRTHGTFVRCKDVKDLVAHYNQLAAKKAVSEGRGSNG